MKQFNSVVFFFALLFLFQFSNAQLTVSVDFTAACNGADGEVHAVVSGGTPPYTFNWYTADGYMADADSFFNGIAGGGWDVEVVDALSNSQWGSAWIPYVFDMWGSSNSATCDMADGSAYVEIFGGGTPPFSFEWSNGSTDSVAIGLTAGFYDVTVTDAGGCQLAVSQTDSLGSGIQVWENSPVSIGSSSTPSSCNDGTATATPTGGVGPYLYHWETNPPQFTPTATDLPSGWVIVNVEDANGCNSQGWVNVPAGPAPFSVTTSISHETCFDADGGISTTVSGGTPPYTYAWSTGETTPNIGTLIRGWYGLTVTDFAGCPVSKSLWLNRLDPLNLGVSSTPPTCGNSDGTATVTISGSGTPPYIVTWSNGGTGNTVAALAPGGYSVTVTDANGCRDHKNVYLSWPSSCFGHITGQVVNDQNSNCIKEFSESGVANRWVSATGGAWNRADANGNYSVRVVPGSYDVSLHNWNTNFNLLCPITPGTISASIAGAGDVDSGNDFFLEPIGNVSDLRVTVYSGLARPGVNHHIYVYYSNDGNQVLNASLQVTHDAAVNYVSSIGESPTFYDGLTQTATYDFPGLIPGESGYFQIKTSVPISTLLGTTLTHSGSIDPSAGDATPANNSSVTTRVVVNSYDPNTKEVSPSGTLPVGPTELTYTINFQNEGSADAIDVMLTDDLDLDLDMSTLREGFASAPYTLTIENRTLKFMFNNINLRPKLEDEEGSKGFVTFKITHLPGLPVSATIENQADIFFDFNPPITTNSVVNDFGFLPIEYVSFEAEKVGQDAELNWQVGSITSLDKFNIMRMVPGGEFEEIGSIEGSEFPGFSSFSFTDKEVDQYGADRLFYQIVGIEKDGNSVESDIRQIMIDGSGGVSVFPNPFKSNFNIEVNLQKGIDGKVQIYDLNGRLIDDFDYSFSAGTNRLYVPSLNAQAPGVYFISIQMGDETFKQKITKM